MPIKGLYSPAKASLRNTEEEDRTQVKDWSKYEKYFKSYEFDSPDLKGSGRAMKEAFVRKLYEARDIAEKVGRALGIRVVFNINSGVRTPEHNKKVGGKKDSAHLTGWACDIAVKNSVVRRIILNSLIAVGLDVRIGIGETYIHVDSHPDLDAAYWVYPCTKKGSISLIKNIFSKEPKYDI